MEFTHHIGALIVRRAPRHQWRATRADDELMNLIAGVIKYMGSIVKMVMSAEIDHASCTADAVPELVTISRKVSQAIAVVYLKSRLMTENKDMRKRIARKLTIQPGLIHFMRINILVKPSKKGVIG